MGKKEGDFSKRLYGDGNAAKIIVDTLIKS
jgi:hypothetical protein